ncbi:MAG: hypothetical protein IJT94_15230, partial [Oscillibacter sp.]|nr:hypothetical protein [Oscillibacter sp.]
SKKPYTYYCCENQVANKARPATCDFRTWDVPVKDACPVCGQTQFKRQGRGARKPFCINPACPNFLPEDKRGYPKRKAAEDGGENAEAVGSEAMPEGAAAMEAGAMPEVVAADAGTVKKARRTTKKSDTAETTENKTAAKKPAAKKSTAKKTTAAKTTAKKATAAKTAAKSTTAKKTTTTKTTTTTAKTRKTAKKTDGEE